MKTATKQIAYKVTTKDRKSTWAPSSLAVQYAIGVVTRPRIVGTKLVVFASEEAARVYGNNSAYDARIFRCEVTSPKPMRWLFDQHSVAKMKHFFKTGEIEDRLEIEADQVALARYSKNTLAVTSVKLLEELD